MSLRVEFYSFNHMKPNTPNIHRPCHFSVNPPGEYFITGRIINKMHLMATDERKSLFLDIFFNKCIEFEIDPITWFVGDNHYHASLASKQDIDLGHFSNRIHSISATLFNQQDSIPGRRIWYQYWDRQIRTEIESWQFMNYVHFNAIKHGLVKSLKELTDYTFCSFGLWHDVLGKEAVELFLDLYPIEDFDPFKR